MSEKQNTRKVESKKCDWKLIIKKKIPIISWLPEYNLKYFLHDILAGITVALTEIPQSLAYAGIAGLPLQYGLYSSFMGGFIYAIFGSCRTISMGSTSIMALLIQRYVREFGVDASIFLSFFGGIIVLIFGILNLGFVIDFFSYPIMSGFTSAAALTIASTQIKSFLGVKGQAVGFLESWQDVAKIQEINKWDTVLGTLSLLTLIILKELGTFCNKLQNKKLRTIKNIFLFLSLAKNAIVVIISILIAYYLETNDLKYLSVTGYIDNSFPYFKLPNFENYSNYFQAFGVSLIFIPLVAILETIAIAKVFSNGKSLDGSQEMIALGIANLMGSFVQSMPVTGSFSRTAVNNASGAKSNIAAVLTGATILTAIPLLTSTFYYIPKATLASIIICAMIYLFDYEAFGVFWKNKMDFIPFSTTLIASLFWSLEYGILVGIATHLIFILYTAARPQIKFEELNNDVFLIAPKTDILFPGINYLRDSLLKFNNTSVIIFDGSLIDHMDITVAKTITHIVKEFKNNNQTLILYNFQKPIKKLCLSLDNRLQENFKEREDLLQDWPSIKLNEVLTI